MLMLLQFLSRSLDSSPQVQYRVRNVSCRPIIGVHLAMESVDGGRGKEAGYGATCAAPHNVGWGVVVPFCYLTEDLRGGTGVAKVTGKVVEALGGGRSGQRLREMLSGLYCQG